MMRRQVIIILCAIATLMAQPYAVLIHAQETPRTDPTASAPEAHMLPPQANKSASPATHPAAADQTLSQRFPNLRGAEGYWRLGKDASGVWWFVSPKGKAEFLNSVTTVQPTLKGRQRDGADYISRDWNHAGDHDAELERWAAATLTRVRDTGFKALGAWSHPILHNHDVPMTRDLNVWTWLRDRAVRMYSPEFAVVAEATIKAQVSPLRENRNLVGYYTDNELDWGDTAVGPGVYFDGLTATDPNRAAVVNVIRKTWPTLQAFNTDWNAALGDWAELDAWKALPRDPVEAYRKLGSAWLFNLATDYFKLTTSLVKKYDPNHLVLGVRFRGYMVPEVVAASRDFTDAQSLNYYVPDALLDRGMFDKAYEASGQPLIITEYSFHSLDGRSGNRNTVGFPAQVPDQAARAEAYKLFTSRLARVPYIVGADWFQWMDEPPTGRRLDGEDVNFGMVDVDDRPYETLAAAVKATTPLLNDFHGQSYSDAAKDVWRDTAASKPTFRIPYLANAPRLNGELSDWPAASKLPDVKMVRTVGHERTKTAMPNMMVGWREEGVYVAFEVFDDHVAAAPIDGWWWSKDSIEFWVSTKAPALDQMAFDPSCHHFYFVPVDFPNRDGMGGAIGQWHAPGSAIRSTMMPHPDAKVGVRMLRDRYVVEIFLPAKALNGFDPARNSTLAFNASVRNFEIAAEYYWSAPKLVVTQARPHTWGAISLAPAPAPAAPVIAGGADGAGERSGTITRQDNDPATLPLL